MDFFGIPQRQYSIDPAADAEEELRRAMLAGQPPATPRSFSVLSRTRQSISGGQRQPAAEAPKEAADELGAARPMLARALGMYGASPDVTALNEYAAQRAREGDSSMLNALAAQFAGEEFQPMQAQFLRRSMAAQEPMKFGNYGYLAGGKFVSDPFASRDTQASAMIDVGGKLLDSEEAAAREARLARNYAQSANFGATRLQQGSAFMLPDGKVVQGMFDPNRGYVYSTPEGVQPLPADARPTTPSTGGPLSQSQFIKLRDEQRIENSALTKLNNYFATVKSADVGFQRLASQISANAKTLFGSGLSPDELAAQVGRGQLQGLLGLFRETVVGPGVMTEQDAQRVLQALGGNFNLLQNPETVEALLRDLYQSKYARVQFLEGELQRSNAAFGEQGLPITAPPSLGGTQANDEFGEPPPGAVRRK